MTAQVASSTSTTTPSTPRWDSRNTGFISPTRLQQLRANEPRHNFTTSSSDQPSASSSPEPMATPQQEPQQRPPLTGERHTRSSSFFSFRNKPQSHQEPAGSDSVRRSSSLLSRSQSNNAPTGSDSPSSSMSRPMTAPNAPGFPANGGGSLAGSASGTQGEPPQMHPEIRSVVGLTVAHAHKIYFSGPLIRKIELGPDGQKPNKEEGWNEVWAQLGGTTLSVWDMKLIKEASSQGKEVPPAYVNVTDAFVSVLGSITVPATATTPSKRYTNVLTLNTAGSNLLIFSCPSPEALISWATALRLSAWEKSRLEEIYTAHLIRITLSARDIPSTLVRGRREGWARVRLAGQTDWKRVWMVVSAAYEPELAPTTAVSIGATPTMGNKKKRMSNLFTRDTSPPRTGPTKANVSMYLSQKIKDRKKPLLSMVDVTQAFAVYPERPELISRSTLIKVEGRMGTEDIVAGMRGREGWLLIMPELEGGLSQAAEMLKWVVAFHDAFALYGRPQAWTWDPREPTSLMFAYPVGPQKDLLFLDREMAETLDPRDDGTSTTRSRLLNILFDRMRGVQIPPPQASDSSSGKSGPQLPPLSFDNVNAQPERHLLTPITERSSINTHGRAMSVDTQSVLNYRQSVHKQYSPVREERNDDPPAASSAPSDQHRKNAVQLVDEPVGSSSRGNDLPTSPPSGPTSIISSQPGNGTSTRPTSMEEERKSTSSPSLQPVQATSSFMSSVSRSKTSLPPADYPMPSQRSDSPASVLTSPFSLATHNGSMLTSPYSVIGRDTESPTHSPPASPRFQQQQVPASPSRVSRSPMSKVTKLGPTQATSSAASPEDNLGNEAGAMYFMQFEEHSHSVASSAPSAPSESVAAKYKDADMRSTGSDKHSAAASPPPTSPSSPRPRRRGTPMAFASSPPEYEERHSHNASPVSADRRSPISSRQSLGRKPTGARDPVNKTPSHPPHNVQSAVSEDSSDDDDDMDNDLQQRAIITHNEEDLDALAALSYLQVEDSPTQTQAPTRPLAVKQPYPTSTPPPPPDASSQYKSSFALSKQAAERKARAEAKEAAHHVAVHRPGRANGRKKKSSTGWNESSEEEDDDDEEEDDDDDDDADSDRDPSVAPASVRASASVNSHANHSPQPPRLRQVQGQGQGQGEFDQFGQRQPRTLPQIPGGRQFSEYNDEPQPPQAPFAQRPRVNSNARSERYTQYDNAQEYAHAPHLPSQPNPRQNNVWSQVLDPGHGTNALPQNERDTFVQLEAPAHTMTKAFTPQGLLSAGMQDKNDRSAKRQEEIARETGASLVNVPHKPPPPQTGLLGAITAHERDRKREGGVGAALTEREREKRLAEERQRRFDEQQRQQMEQMQSGGSMYGFNPMMNPMMMGMMGINPMVTGQGMNPMMTGQGMNPMMTGQGMNPMMSGFPGMMGGYNPQHMFAAQQAAQAYQQAMMNFSVAGSQVGGDVGQQQAPMNPMMTGMSGMGGFDPRMSMMSMGNPMMGQMGMGSVAGMGGSPSMMGMGGGAMPPNAGTFDARFPPTGTPLPGELLPPNVLTGSPKPSTSGNASPVGRGSPLVRAVDAPNASRPNTPKIN